MNMTSEPRMGALKAALLAIAPVVAAGVAGSVVTMPNIPGWYAALNKPSFNPPNWIFGPVWTLLYVMMAYGYFRVLTSTSPHRGIATLAFLVQIVLNAAWSFAFFGVHSPRLGMAVILALWVAIATTLVLFWRIDRTAGLLFVPYLVWVSFAAVLNGSILALN